MADYRGLDVQTDTYYDADYGKLKLRQGNIENVLIHYHRENGGGAEKTEVLLYLENPSPATIDQICSGRKVLTQIKKKRQIFFIDNVKFHLDQLERLGDFIEIEAIDINGVFGAEVLTKQCKYYKELMQIKEADLINYSYIDL